MPSDFVPQQSKKKKKKKRDLTEAERIAEEVAEAQAKAKAFDDEHGTDFDIVKLMDEAVDPLTGTLRDLKIDDRDLPVAKNYWDWSFNFVGGSTQPWSRQMWAMLKFFGEICPVCSDKKWFRDVMNVPKDYPSKDLPERLVMLEYGVCPKCKRHRRQLIKKGRMNDYTEYVGVWGQRSGKSVTAVNAAGYHGHRFLKFPKLPGLTPGMAEATNLTATFTAPTAGQASAVLWEPFLNVVEECKWYQDYFKLLDHYGNKYGIELYAKKKEFIKFFNKKIHFQLASPNKTTLRGATRILGLIDELGLFRIPDSEDGEDDKERANADEAHKSLTNSLLTMQNSYKELLSRGFFHCPNGLMMSVSSPFSDRDKVMRLLAEAEGDIGSKLIFGTQLATWEVNPNIEKTDPIIALAYEKNPDKADRDFGARPPRIESPFIHVNTVKEGIFVGTKNTHELEHAIQGGKLYGTLRRVANTGAATLMSLDAGEVNNSFSMTLFTLDTKTMKPALQTLVEVMPREGYRIDHNLVYENIILPLAKECNSHVIIADRWNSLDILSRLTADLTWDPIVQQITPRRKDFDAVRTMLENDGITCPLPEIPLHSFINKSVEDYRQFFVNKPIAHLAHQMTTIRDDGPGKCPVKGHRYTDDSFRAFALGAARIHTPKFVEKLQKAMTLKSRGPMPAAVYISRGGIRR
ncbi:large subunit terminase [Achromobacter phage Motura]|uniref:Large subunit terminase n=1 Tax=Achromobacter phage Motura TaxID=2591403 RepID=A0A514CSJ2_9CAUD|nr:terminase large subunit [Achromobacter phage Motura]QDH83448.1 large subunit terminase [Achromobacter phage Motura]